MILFKSRNYENERFQEIIQDIRELASEESLSLRRMACMIEKIQEYDISVAEVIRKTGCRDRAIGDGVCNTILGNRSQVLVEGVIFDNISQTNSVASQLILEPAEQVQAKSQSVVILDRVLDVVPYDTRFLSLLKNTCKWYSNVVSKHIISYRSSVSYENYIMKMRYNASLARKNPFTVDQNCVFHNRYECNCEIVWLPCRDPFINKFIRDSNNPHRLHALLVESDLLLNDIFFRLVLKMRKIDEWMILFFMFHTMTITKLLMFFKYEDGDKVIQMCDHYIKRVYLRSRYHFFSSFGSEIGKIEESVLYGNAEYKKGMTFEHFMENSVYGVSFFRDFLNDDGDGLDTRKIGDVRRNILNTYEMSPSLWLKIGTVTHLRCCDEEIVEVQEDFFEQMINKMRGVAGLVHVNRFEKMEYLGGGGYVVPGRRTDTRKVRRRRKKNIRK